MLNLFLLNSLIFNHIMQFSYYLYYNKINYNKINYNKINYNKINYTINYLLTDLIYFYIVISSFYFIMNSSLGLI